MVSINGETSYTRSEKAEIHSQSYPTRSRNAGSQSASTGNQQKRVNRAHSKELSCFDTRTEGVDSRTTTPGGTVTQLIQDTEQQIAVSEAHALKLRNHLQKLYILRDQLGEE